MPRQECCHGDLAGRCLLCRQAAEIASLRDTVRAQEGEITRVRDLLARSVETSGRLVALLPWWPAAR